MSQQTYRGVFQQVTCSELLANWFSNLICSCVSFTLFSHSSVALSPPNRLPPVAESSARLCMRLPLRLSASLKFSLVTKALAFLGIRQ